MKRRRRRNIRLILCQSFLCFGRRDGRVSADERRKKNAVKSGKFRLLALANKVTCVSVSGRVPRVRWREIAVKSALEEAANGDFRHGLE